MLRRIVFALVALIVVSVAAVAVVKYRADRNFYVGYSSAHPLKAVEETPTVVDGDVNAFGLTLPARYRRQAVAFDGDPGERVPAVLTMPLEASAPVPVIILLHGSHQEKEFVEQISTPFNEAGFAMVCFDQYMRGERRVRGNVLEISRAFRDRCRKTVHDTQRLIDYLQTRPDIDSERVYLVGASYGAITGTVVIARDKRIRAAALVVGGGNFWLLAKAPEVRRELPQWIWPFAGPLMVFAAGVADPVRHAADTAGTPVLMLNGSNDGVVTPESGEALFAALGEPKEIHWYPVDHPDREPDGEKVIEMLNDGLDWFLKWDAPFRSETGEEPLPLEEPKTDAVAAG